MRGEAEQGGVDKRRRNEGGDWRKERAGRGEEQSIVSAVPVAPSRVAPPPVSSQERVLTFL